MSTRNVFDPLAAFTLIEIVVVLAIVGIMSTLMLVSYSTGQTEKQLENAARELVAVLRQGQNDALTGRLIGGAGIPATALPCRYSVTNGGSTTTYKSVFRYRESSTVDCGAKVGDPDVAPEANVVDYTVATYTLPGGVTFADVKRNAVYYPPHAEPLLYPASNPLVFRLTKSGASAVVCAYQNGLIAQYAGANCP